MSLKFFFTVIILLALFVVFNYQLQIRFFNILLLDRDNDHKTQSLEKEKFFDEILKSRILFISGSGRSGTTLMRSILDTHEYIKCGPETPFLPNFIESFYDLKQNYRTINVTLNRGFKEGFIEKAIGMLLVYVMENKSYKSNYLCEKSPKLMKIGNDLHKSLPNAKFIYMIRDGREVAYSFLIKLNQSLEFKSFIRHLKTWDNLNKMYFDVCQEIGNSHCKMVRYSDLVLNTNKTMRDISKFLQIKWTDKFLNHQDYIGTDIFTVEDEWSHKQIIKPIFNDSFKKWLGKITDYDEKYVNDKIPMLKILNFYD